MLSSPNEPGGRRRRLVEELDVALLVGVRVVLPGGRHQVEAVGVEDRLALEHAEPRAQRRAGAQQDAVVALDPVVAGAGVDRVAGVGAARAGTGGDGQCRSEHELPRARPCDRR